MDFILISEVLANWFNKEVAKQVLDVAFLLLAGLIVQQIILFISGRFRRRIEGGGVGSESARIVRANTITNVLFTSLSIVGWIIISIMILDKLGVNIAPVLASAGVLGLAVSFGSQELVKDVISGFFFLLENQFNVGDVIEVKGKKGQVVDMNLRTVSLKDLENDAVYIFRNSQVDMVARYNKRAEMEALKKSKEHEKA
jgi:moderate conductance mechanosensitive channel